MSIREDDPLAQERVATFRQALAELGWTEGRNLTITWRWTGGDMVRVREYATELVQLAPEVILANGTPNVAALQRATTAIPIVFAVVNDPVAQGFIASMAHPGGTSPAFPFLSIQWLESRWRCSNRSLPTLFASRSCSTRTPIPTTTSICDRLRRSQGCCRLS